MKPNLRILEDLALTRLSPNFLLRDFLFSTSAAARGMSNAPEDPEMVVRAGKQVCQQVLEPLSAEFGRPAITFGYQSREAIDTPATANSRSSNPHQWDRGTFGRQVYARVDILPFCVEDGLVSKLDYGRWMMHNLDIDLLMQWTRSNVLCVTISPKPRRVWVEWGAVSRGEPKRQMLMGPEYWQEVYPRLPPEERPKYGPSHTGGSMQWMTS